MNQKTTPKKCPGKCGNTLKGGEADAISRYGHGSVCGDCGTREAMEGDFISSSENEHKAWYTLYIEPDQFADPQRYPNGIAWRSGILDKNGEEIDGEGDIATYEEARDLAMNTLARLLENK